MKSYLIADASELDPRWVDGAAAIGVTAGASAPEAQVQDVLSALGRLSPLELTTVSGTREKVEFRLPARLLAPNPTDADADRAPVDTPRH